MPCRGYRGYRVDARAVRDHINSMKNNVKAKNNIERAASGIAPEETETEKRIREAIEQMIQEEEDIELAPKEKGDEEKKKADGAEIRKRACETFGETRKRHLSDGSATGTGTPRRVRNTGRDAMAWLERKLEMDIEMKREEMERKRLEDERRRAEEAERQQEEAERCREEAERRRVEEERRQAEEAAKERRYELIQQQLLQTQQQLLQQQQHNEQQNRQLLLQQQQNQQLSQQMLAAMMALVKSMEKKE